VSHVLFDGGDALALSLHVADRTGEQEVWRLVGEWRLARVRPNRAVALALERLQSPEGFMRTASFDLRDGYRQMCAEAALVLTGSVSALLRAHALPTPGPADIALDYWRPRDPFRD
jgi:hypothetical protein